LWFDQIDHYIETLQKTLPNIIISKLKEEKKERKKENTISSDSIYTPGEPAKGIGLVLETCSQRSVLLGRRQSSPEVNYGKLIIIIIPNQKKEKKRKEKNQ